MWLSLLIKHWKYAVMAGLLIVVAGFYLTVKLQGIKLDRKDMELSAYKATYFSQREAITNLQKDMESANKTCTKRIKEKDALIRKFQEIDNTSTQPVEDGSNPLLNKLNSMFRNPQ